MPDTTTQNTQTSQNKEHAPTDLGKIVEIEVETELPYYELLKPTDTEQHNYADMKPKAMPGESGHFASVQYHIECETIKKAPEDQVWEKKDFGSSEPIYVYTPKDKIALVRHVLEEKKVNYVINDYSLDIAGARGRKICHFFTRGLSVGQREFLVKCIVAIFSRTNTPPQTA